MGQLYTIWSLKQFEVKVLRYLPKTYVPNGANKGVLEVMTGSIVTKYVSTFENNYFDELPKIESLWSKEKWIKGNDDSSANDS